MTGEIFEVDGIIPYSDLVDFLELISYEKNGEYWDENVRARLGQKYCNLSLSDLYDLPDNDVFSKSKKIKFLGGEKVNACYSPLLKFNVDLSEVSKYGNESPEQPSTVMGAAKRIAAENQIGEGDVVICPDHGLGIAISLQAKRPDTLVSFDWHSDRKVDANYTRASWVRHLNRNPMIFGYKEKPAIIRTKTMLTSSDISKIRGSLGITVCMDVLSPYYADAVINLRNNGGMELEDLLSNIETLQKRNNVVSLSVCERRRILDDKENTALAVQKIVDEFLKH